MGMKQSLLASVFSVATLQLACAPRARVNPAATPTVNTEQEVLRLSREKWRWMAERKVDTLAALFHNQAVFVHMGGTMTRAQELDVIRSGAIQYKQADIHAASVRFAGNTAIVARGRHPRRKFASVPSMRRRQ